MPLHKIKEKGIIKLVNGWRKSISIINMEKRIRSYTADNYITNFDNIAK